jgi:hypothetical protein
MSVINAGSQSIQFWDDVQDHGNVGGTFEHGASGITQTIRVAFTDQAQAIRDILGSQSVAQSVLTRNPPLQHSIYPAYYATKVGLAGGYSPVGKYSQNTGNDVAQFQYVFLQITYTTLPFSVEWNPSAISEFFRYVSKLPQPGVEFLKVGTTGTQYQYVSNATPPPFGPNGLIIPFGNAVRLQKTTLQYKWWFVPEEYIFNLSGLPANIANGVGCVNVAAWPNLGNVPQPGAFPANTLLCMPPQFEAVNSPEPLLNTGPTTPQGGPWREYNVTFNFLYFNPPQNALDMTPWGHNAVGWGDGKFYLAQTVNGGKPLYPSYDYNKFFQGVL